MRLAVNLSAHSIGDPAIALTIEQRCTSTASTRSG